MAVLAQQAASERQGLGAPPPQGFPASMGELLSKAWAGVTDPYASAVSPLAIVPKFHSTIAPAAKLLKEG